MTGEQIKALREQTGAGMMACKEALLLAGADMDKAIEILRKRGVAVAAKKAGRVAAEGLLGFAMGAGDAEALLLEVNCETDFVAKNPEFIEFIDKLAQLALAKRVADLDTLLALPFPEKSLSVADKIQDLIAKIGENIAVRRLLRLERQSATELLVSYLHPGNRIGVLLRASGGEKSNELCSFLKDVAMHIAAMSPRYLTESEIPAADLAKEKEIVEAQLAADPSYTQKPAAIREKIVTGKIAKFKKDSNLLDQLFVRDPEGKLSVGEWIGTHFKGLELLQFVRYQVGEGIEKKLENFREEVARQVAGR